MTMAMLATTMMMSWKLELDEPEKHDSDERKNELHLQCDVVVGSYEGNDDT